MDGQRLPVRLHPPRLGEHSRELLASAGFEAHEIDGLVRDGVVA
jgi:crotonobetainyl-CoA:carnitine CoA-transferase CaiB-like acyl-CoA transferase